MPLFNTGTGREVPSRRNGHGSAALGVVSLQGRLPRGMGSSGPGSCRTARTRRRQTGPLPTPLPPSPPRRARQGAPRRLLRGAAEVPRVWVQSERGMRRGPVWRVPSVRGQQGRLKPPPRIGDDTPAAQQRGGGPHHWLTRSPQPPSSSASIPRNRLTWN